ncbi:uncharacterized protein PAC_01613 [Phialocephala subalpina]|uniref:Uncharacterized protein n=1 Tax=Phialocephala subalpina TaxID=576137 RepID=A0A1L7WG32_9HELO|nr:uncharacterized protein PAC_01613 [Phialocephala subalpina]
MDSTSSIPPYPEAENFIGGSLPQLRIEFARAKDRLKRDFGNAPGRESEWTAEEYVRRFETGNMNYEHLQDSEYSLQLQDVFLKVHGYLRMLPSQSLITSVAALMSMKWIRYPLDFEEYAKQRFEAGKDCLEQIAINMPNLIPLTYDKLTRMVIAISRRESGLPSPAFFPPMTVTKIHFLNNLPLDTKNGHLTNLHARVECELNVLYTWIFRKQGHLDDSSSPDIGQTSNTAA